jgi:UDP-N-acetyl-D-galactosamine dehydrogenase
LEYVGLPLTIEFSKHFTLIGLDINIKRIAELNAGYDYMLEAEPVELRSLLKMELFLQVS